MVPSTYHTTGSHPQFAVLYLHEIVKIILSIFFFGVEGERGRMYTIYAIVQYSKTHSLVKKMFIVKSFVFRNFSSDPLASKRLAPKRLHQSDFAKTSLTPSQIPPLPSPPPHPYSTKGITKIIFNRINLYLLILSRSIKN